MEKLEGILLTEGKQFSTQFYFIRSKTMQKSPDLWDIAEVAAYFGTSESTIRRKTKKRRETGYGFVPPLFSAGSRLLWRKADIEAWKGEDAAETVMFMPSTPSMPPVAQQSHEHVQRELRKLGVKLPEKKNN